VEEIIKGYFEMGMIKKRPEVIAYLKSEYFWREEYNSIADKVIPTPISLSDTEGACSRAEFTRIKDQIQQWAAENLSIDIKDPDKNWRMWKLKEDDNYFKTTNKKTNL